MESTLQNVKDSKSSGASDQDNVESTLKKDKAVHVGNTILSSTSKFLVKSESTGKAPQNTEQGDDAVLYKPHDKTAQFNQINTHKNEDLRENLIVPDWNTCLPQTATNPIFNTSTTSNQGNANQTVRTDITNWRQFLGQISSKFGFSNPTLPEEEEQSQSPGIESNIERDVGLLYEKSYKLYGKSLAVLPENKRACLQLQ